MADISVEKKQGGQMTWIWAVAAVIAVAALMIWLLQTQSETTTVVTEEAPMDTVADAAATPTSEVVDLAALAATPDQFTGRPIQLAGVEIASILGNRGFWLNVEGGNPFLVILGAEIAEVPFLTDESTVTLEGSVQPVTEEAVSSWVDAQLIRPGSQAEASFATHFLGATSITVASDSASAQ